MDDLLRLDGRTALITGAGQGIGAQIARHCAEHGARVLVNDFNGDRAEAVASEIRDKGGQAIAYAADVTDYDAVQTMTTRAVDELGPVSILVNNAGNAGAASDPMAPAPAFWETSPQDWQRWVDVNFYGVLNATRACVPGMVAREYGRVITVISDAALVGDAQLVVYGGAKAGAAGFSRGLARAVGRYGITVNCVALSAVRTPGVATAVDNADLVKAMLRSYPIRRLGDPSDAANLVLFLASRAAEWITGQTYPVNGGFAVST